MNIKINNLATSCLVAVFALFSWFNAGAQTYCTPSSTNSSYYINNFSTTGGVTNISNLGTGYSAGGYGNYYSSQIVTAAQGNTINFSAVFTSGQTFGFRVWVDWNNDGTFDVIDEVAFSSASYAGSHTGIIQVPGNAHIGPTRMRIVNHWLSGTGSVDPCATGFTYGEFEDYQFVITQGSGTVNYCTPSATNASYYINNFTTTGGTVNISNTGSGFSPGGYGNFYNTHTVSQVVGGNVDFTADFPPAQTFGFRAWVDWNRDGIFQGSEVVFSSGSYASSHSGTISVPLTATPGDTRMRIVNHWLSSTGDIGSCAIGFTYGEFEDYKFTVVGAPPPPAGDTTPCTIVCPGDIYTTLGGGECSAFIYYNVFAQGGCTPFLPFNLTQNVGSASLSDGIDCSNAAAGTTGGSHWRAYAAQTQTFNLNAVEVGFYNQGYGTNLHCQIFVYSYTCLLYTSPSPRDGLLSRMPSSA